MSLEYALKHTQACQNMQNKHIHAWYVVLKWSVAMIKENKLHWYEIMQHLHTLVLFS